MLPGDYGQERSELDHVLMLGHVAVILIYLSLVQVESCRQLHHVMINHFYNIKS